MNFVQGALFSREIKKAFIYFAAKDRSLYSISKCTIIHLDRKDLLDVIVHLRPLKTKVLEVLLEKLFLILCFS